MPTNRSVATPTNPVRAGTLARPVGWQSQEPHALATNCHLFDKKPAQVYVSLRVIVALGWEVL